MFISICVTDQLLFSTMVCTDILPSDNVATVLFVHFTLEIQLRFSIGPTKEAWNRLIICLVLPDHPQSCTSAHWERVNAIITAGDHSHRPTSFRARRDRRCLLPTTLPLFLSPHLCHYYTLGKNKQYLFLIIHITFIWYSVTMGNLVVE